MAKQIEFTPTAASHSPTMQAATSPALWKDKLTRMNGELENALVGRIPIELFIRAALTMINKNPKLGSCTETSILAALLDSAQLGLVPDSTLGYAYIIPYGNTAQFQIGYKGLVQLMRDEGAREIQAEVVYAADIFEYENGSNSFLRHVPNYDVEDRGEIKYAWASIKNKQGGFEFRILPIKRLKEIRAMSKQSNSPAWANSLDEMYRKTVLKNLAKTQSLSQRTLEIIGRDDKTEFEQPNEVHVAPITATKKPDLSPAQSIAIDADMSDSYISESDLPDFLRNPDRL